MSKQPTLSVLMCNYNHAQFLPEALDAIVSQLFKSFEVIVCDDGSTDNSVEIIQRFVRRYTFVRLVRNNTNLGIFASLDKLMAIASGDYLYGAAADDRILPGFFEKSMKLLLQYPQAGLCSARTLCIDAQGRNRGILHAPVIIGKGGFVSSDKALSMLYRQGSWMQGNTVIFRKRALINSGGFIPELYSFSDGFIHQVIAVKYGVCFIPEPLTAWRQLDSSYSVTIAKDSVTSLQWIHYAKKLMLTTYHDLFSSDFVDCWEKRELINFHLLRYYNLQNDALQDLERLNLTRSLTGRCLFGFRKLLAKIDYFILKFYLYRRAKLFANQLIIQKMKSFWVTILK